MIRCLIALALLLPLAGGCFPQRSLPERVFYGIEAPRQGPPRPEPRFDGVRVQRFEMPGRTGGDRFVYRRDDLRFEEDPYSRFFTPPREAIAEETRRWLDASGLFRQAVSGPTRIESRHLLEGRIVALYGDFRKGPCAIMTLELTFLREAEDRTQVLLRRTYRSEIPLPQSSASALARGWSRALGEILQSLEADLAALPELPAQDEIPTPVSELPPSG